jgi:16S rRNA (adenine1518-N6/adenine1519-N6)-dimethyltransferase
LRLEETSFINFLKQAFAQKRKTLANNLRAAGVPSAKAAEAIAAARVSAQIRAEALSLAEFAAIWQALSQG